jgi:hypothetical protein
MNNTPDPLAGIIAARIKGITRIGDNGPFLLFDAEPAPDGNMITLTVTRHDFTTIGGRAMKVLMHLSPQMPIDDAEPPPTPCTNGVVDPVIARADGNQA